MNTFTATGEIPRGRWSRARRSLANEVLHGIDWQEFQRGATMDGRPRPANGENKVERGERERERERKTLLRNVTPGLLL